MNVFFDSSALAKRYVEEKGSERVEAILSFAAALGVSVICLPEVISALCRRRRERRLSKNQYADAKRALILDLEDASVIGMTDQVIARSVELLEHWRLRSADALHIAGAAEWSAQLFVSADERQCRAARAYGLRVEELKPG
ncbi:MAG: type II toxin-antitoxin system VapC family toxin [Deltaproteobacteria bacterium]|nr:type II toxin-antitoxin system VapC family toxin [Deltaproteobacteria bacterium]